MNVLATIGSRLGWLIAASAGPGTGVACYLNGRVIDASPTTPATREAAQRWLRAVAGSRCGGTCELPVRRLTRVQVGHATDAGIRCGATVAYVTHLEDFARAVAAAYQHINGGLEAAESEFEHRALERSAEAMEARYAVLCPPAPPNVDLSWSVLEHLAGRP